MSRLKWLRAEWPISIRKLGQKIKSNQFTQESVDGFILDRIRDDFIEGSYVEKFSIREIVVDPFGGEQTFNRTTYRTLGFNLHASYPQISLYDPHRNTRDFISRLLEFCDFSVAISPITINVLDWIGNFQQLTNQQTLVDSIQVSGIQYQKNILAKLLIKGEQDVRNSLDSIVNGKTFCVDQLQFHCLDGKKDVQIQLASNGSLRISSDHLETFRIPLRESLPPPSRLNS